MNDTQESKRGRKPAHESRSVEIRQRITEWKAMPRQQRPPITKVAHDLGISHQLASYHASQVPWPDPFAEAVAGMRARLPRIMEMWIKATKKKARARGSYSRVELRFLRKLAGAGNAKAQALLRKVVSDADWR